MQEGLSSGDALITLTGVAELAHVQRPVVSMWRKRPVAAGHHAPFPSAVDESDGVERFRMDDIVDWLERTGRGNNPDARSDAMAYVAPPTLTVSGVPAYDAVTAMLCLAAVVGEDLAPLHDADLLDLADEADPDDAMLFREVDALGADRPVVAHYVDHLIDAAYHPSGALDRVMARRWSETSDHGARLASAAHDLAGQVAAALAVDVTASDVTFVDATGGRTPLTLDALRALDERIDASVQIVGDSEAARRSRRVTRISGYDLRVDDDVAGPAVILAQFPHDTTPGMRPEEIFEAIDDIQVGLDHDSRLVVVGPASVLCDSLRDADLDLQRDHLVRRGFLRAVLRLPRGLVPERSRQSLGLWLLGPPHTGHTDRQRIVTGDVVNEELTATVIDDVVSDVVAATKSSDVAQTHVFRASRPTLRARLLTGRGTALVPAGSTRRRTSAGGSSADRVVHVSELMDELRSTHPLTAPRTIEVEASGASDLVFRNATLADLVASGAVRSIPGSRVDDEAVAAGTVRLIAPKDLEPASGEASASVDAVDLESRHPRARRTEPGDIVFCTTPRPRAIVDHDGMSVAVSPARVLRCDPSRGLVPEVVAHLINSQPARSQDWRAWQVPIMPVDAVGDMAAALQAIVADAAQSRHRLGLLAELADQIIDGAAIGAMTVHTRTNDAEKG